MSEQIGGGDRGPGGSGQQHKQVEWRSAAPGGGGGVRKYLRGSRGPRAGRRAGGLHVVNTSDFIFIRAKVIFLHPKRKDGVL